MESCEFSKQLNWKEPRSATVTELEWIHSKEHIDHVKQVCESGGGYLDPDTTVCPESYNIALKSAGAWLDGVDEVLAGNSALVLSRPPGHHAEADRAMGFCLFSNSALAATYALKQNDINRVAIFDWDVHHGNGTQDIVQSNPNIVYCGMGEHAPRGVMTSYGDGMYKSVDGGKNFTQLANTTSWNAVGKIAVDPNNSNRVYAATNTGLMVSDDAGESWQAAFNAFNSNAKDLFVTVSGKVWVKQGSGVYRSDNGNVGSFSLAPGLPSITGRARIAASPEDDQYVYVVACDNFGHFDKAYQSKDGGNTWNIIGQRSSLLNPHGAQGNPQGNYNNMLGVSPINKERIFVGGVTLWEWSAQNGWLQIASLGDAPGSTFYVHADNL